MNQLIDNNNGKQGVEQAMIERNRLYLERVLILTLINILVYPFVAFSANTAWFNVFFFGIVGYGFAFPVCYLILGGVVAFLPYQALTWKQKYKRSVLLVALVCSTIILVLSIVGLLRVYLFTA